ncbi:MAG TPA: oligoendopeptidase F, partial [Anaerolineae bacterium]|nr:oligoendopeptidase F [Anaerolineae bacterium]
MIMYKQKAWSLDELFLGFDDPAIETTIEEMNALVVEIEAFRPKLTPTISPENLSVITTLMQKLTTAFYRLGGFASLSFSSDTRDQQAQILMARVGQLSADLQNRTLFFSLWWKELDEQNAARLLKTAGDQAYWLTKLRHDKPFTLTEAEEKIINLKDVNGVTILRQLYTSITSRFTYKLEIDGVEQELSRAQLSTYNRSPDPDLRKAAYQELLRVYEKESPILGQIYQGLMRDWHSEYVTLRGNASPMSVRNRGNDIPDEVVNTLLQVVRKNAAIFHRFFALKAKWLGVEKLRRYDVYAPITQAEKKYPFGEAVSLVLDSFSDFEPRIAALAKRVFEDNHYDSEDRKGKRGGAFCSTLGPDLTPWVLQSFNGEPRDVSTMAHELGHAIHSMLAEHHTIINQHPSLPLAETASTFGEMLLLDKLLATDPDPALQRDLLFSNMDGAYATIMRQAYFAIFEIEAHTAIQKDASIDDLSALHIKILR